MADWGEMITFAKQMRTINTYDYWKDITRENKDAALIRMLEAAVKRDMTAEKPAWVINYPSTKLYNTVGMKLVDAVIKQN